MTQLLEQLHQIMKDPEQLASQPEVATYADSFVAVLGQQDQPTLLRALFDKESRIAGYLIFLAQHAPAQLTALFFRQPKTDALRLAAFSDPLLSFGDDAYRAILSPVGIIHLYREYFFEFDSFLGPAVGHVWLSPGGTIELVEVNTRKVFTEQTFETLTEIVQRSESETTTQDDVADAVKEENRNNVKFGFTNVASYTTPVFQDTATASFSLDNAQTVSREGTVKHMRRQSEKLSSDIKRNFKTTFKTSTEVTDTTSKRYVIQNKTDRLVNYELRRKMRKVGVQVQDIGVQLCWHAFVDDPARELGVAKLVHLGEPPNMAGLVEPEGPEIPAAKSVEYPLTLPFQGVTGNNDTDQAYRNGVEVDQDLNEGGAEEIHPNYPLTFTYPTPGFTLAKALSPVDPMGNAAEISATVVENPDGASRGKVNVHLDYVDWKDADKITAKLTLIWEPSATTAETAQAEYDRRLGLYNAEKARK